MRPISIAEHKWWKIGAAAFLSVGILAACGDDEKDPNMDDNQIDEDIKQDVDIPNIEDTEVEEPK
ncbi:hypothetical protein [Psychrobacillus vulpis]|uniref:Lipoprotein n=1 Tax=Psychrobacillus vulpis TaxID=2325572 RepID=A0A544TS87_9BACI|nr:hypothetical protein [Psychrobacillus vulpis]TQR20309.1 hypothetical protein FG384_07655 [Psychrobacillus vulpis]